MNYDKNGCAPQFRISSAPLLKSEIAVVLELLIKNKKKVERIEKI